MLIVALVLMVALSTVYIAGRERNKKKVLVFKALATLVADFLAIGFAWQSGRALAWWFAVGIFFYACADVALEIKFLYGMSLFAAGHVCLIAGMLPEEKIGVDTVAAFLLLAGAGAWLFRRYLPKMRRLMPVALSYVGVLCLMSSMTVSMAIRNFCAGTVLRAVGSVCFLISDGIIGWNYLRRKRTKSSGVLLLTLYYVALYLLAAGLYV